MPSNVKVEFAFKNWSMASCSSPKRKKVKLDDPPSGEGATSFSRHNLMLKSEHIKAHPNKPVVQEQMKVTFEMRRHDIVKNKKRLTQIMNDYPFLTCPDEVRQMLTKLVQQTFWLLLVHMTCQHTPFTGHP